MKNIISGAGGYLALILALGLGQRVAAQATYTPYQFITLAGAAGSSGAADGTGSAAQFDRASGVAVDGSGNVYIGDTGNDTIREITPGGMVTTLAGVPGVSGSADGTGSAARFNNPVGVAVDGSGNLYVADFGNNTIREIKPGGMVTTVGGTPGVAGNGDGPGPTAHFNQPAGVAVDGNGDLYIADLQNDSIRKITPTLVNGVTTWTVSTLAGEPGSVSSSDGTGSAASFSGPAGVALDGNGNIYVADFPQSVVRKIAPGVVVTTLAGTAGIYGSIDGTGSAALFDKPSGVAVDGSGNVYVTDIFNDTIRRITPAGVVTTLGGISRTAGSANGTGPAALFNGPFGIAVDGSGNIYIADSDNNTIRKGLAPSVAPTFTLAASPSTATVAAGRTAVFNAIAAGTPVPTYQWTLNGSATIPGATVTTDPILVITGSTAADDGTIACTATNSVSSISSSGALSVITTTTPGYLDNLSGRGLVGSGASNALYGGFGISGTGTKQLLIRGMGPSLLPGYIFTVSDALLDTQLTLFNNNSVPIGSNSPWGGTAALMAADSLVGAYPPVSTTSLDSMLYVPVGTGPSSATVGGVNGDVGDAVIEIYDADSLPLSAKLNNVSVRAPVGTGNDILFGGFAIGGSTSETVLIRAIGPGLATTFSGSFTPAQVLAQPVLSLYVGGTFTGYTNTGWGSDPALINAMLAVGAYPLVNGSGDSLLLVTLPPGSYSAEIAGLNGTTGIAVVEVYEVY